jgi:hypothetical protein
MHLVSLSATSNAGRTRERGGSQQMQARRSAASLYVYIHPDALLLDRST